MIELHTTCMMIVGNVLVHDARRKEDECVKDSWWGGGGGECECVEGGGGGRWLVGGLGGRG